MSTVTQPAERLGPAPTSPWWAEHRSRYGFARAFVSGRTVLDVACGTGLGAPVLLAGGARRVIGVDLSAEGLAEARRAAPPGLALCRADGTRLPLADRSVDVVTSFETLEHVREHERFLQGLHRVLRPGGRLLLSTPNALHTRPVDGRPRNPYHVREWTPAELGELLAAFFQDVEVLGQRTTDGYGPSPFWTRAEHLPSDLAGGSKTVLWKVLARSGWMQERLSRRVLGRAFYPGEDDFTFDADATESAHVLLAVCRRGERAH